MAELAAQTHNQVHDQINQYERTRADTETWVAEALNGSMQTVFEYSYVGNELYAEDGGELGVIFDDAIEAAQIMTQYNPSLSFELRRRLIERTELTDMQRMARGELPNTMIVISDFPPELMDAKEDVGGYNSSRKQTMMRVITAGPDGTIRTVTQSLEGSNRQALEAIYKTMGEQAQPGELLDQRMHVQLPEEWQSQLVTNLTNTYDASLHEQKGGNWHAGYLQPEGRSMADTYGFACNQQDLIEWFTQAKLADPQGAEKLRYKLAATMHQRYEMHLNGGSAVSMTKSIGSSAVSGGFNHNQMQWHLYNEIDQATDKAIANRQSFSGCGSTVNAEGSLEDQLDKAGYGNKSDEDCEFISKKCPLCNASNVKTTVTKTKITGSCGCVKNK